MSFSLRSSSFLSELNKLSFIKSSILTSSKSSGSDGTFRPFAALFFAAAAFDFALSAPRFLWKSKISDGFAY